MFLICVIAYCIVSYESYDSSEKCKKCLDCVNKYPGQGVLNLIDKGCYDVDICSECGDIIHGDVSSPTVGGGFVFKNKEGSISKT